MKKSFWLFLLLSIIIMIMIFCFSSQTAENSTDLSRIVTESITNFFTNKSHFFTEKEYESFLNSFEKILREAAHFVIFLFLGFFVHGTAVKFKKKSSDKVVVFSLFFCTLYAFLDEFHQFFVSGRTAQSVDLVIDFLGAFLGMKIFSFIYLKYKNNNSKPM